MMIESTLSMCAWVGSILLALQGAPQAYHCWKIGHAEGLSPLFLWMWGLGELLVFFYVLFLMDWALMFNYGMNIVIVSVIMRYKYWPRGKKDPLECA